MGKIFESHLILSWIPTMASDAISFFRIDRDALTAEMRRSGRAWKKLVAEFGESDCCRPAVRVGVLFAVVLGMLPKKEPTLQRLFKPLRKETDAEGAIAVCLRWIDTDKGDAGRPNNRSRFVVGEMKSHEKFR